MEKIKCVACGCEFMVYPSETDRKYCSLKCSNGHRRVIERGEFDHSLTWERTTDRKWLCPYQDSVSCSTRECVRCGWNPEVMKARNEAIMRKLKGEMK
jgi:hypothetical protein